jgi:hypothetical protein
MTKAEHLALYALSIEVCDAGFEADRLSEDQRIEKVLPYVEDWARRRAGDRPATPELVNRMIAEALLAQWFYDYDLLITQAEGERLVENATDSPLSPA